MLLEKRHIAAINFLPTLENTKITQNNPLSNQLYKTCHLDCFVKRKSNLTFE